MQIYVKSSVSNVHHFNYCQWRIPSGGVWWPSIQSECLLTHTTILIETSAVASYIW